MSVKQNDDRIFIIPSVDSHRRASSQRTIVFMCDFKMYDRDAFFRSDLNESVAFNQSFTFYIYLCLCLYLCCLFLFMAAHPHQAILVYTYSVTNFALLFSFYS